MDTLVSYMAIIIELKDQLVATGRKVDHAELVLNTLNGFTLSWKPFVQSVCAHENLPTFD